MTVGRNFRFYDSKNKRVFRLGGERDGLCYTDYKKLMPWEYPDWAIEAQKLLEN